jgi:hypothetical protein
MRTWLGLAGAHVSDVLTRIASALSDDELPSRNKEALFRGDSEGRDAWVFEEQVPIFQQANPM